MDGVTIFSTYAGPINTKILIIGILCLLGGAFFIYVGIHSITYEHQMASYFYSFLCFLVGIVLILAATRESHYIYHKVELNEQVNAKQFNSTYSVIEQTGPFDFIVKEKK